MANTLKTPTLHTAALASLEHLINRALALDTASQRKLKKLNGHVFHFQCLSPTFSIYFTPGEEEIRLCSIFDGNTDTQLSGNMAEFIKLASSDNPSTVLINEPLELAGDSNALIDLQKIIATLDIDWEAPLANVFGDIIGHHLGRNIRGSIKFFRNTASNIKRQLNDYIVEESNWFPARWELDKFYRAIDQANVRSDRLAAKINKASKLITS